MADPADASQSDGNYVVVARRYRPKDFQQLVGQDHVGQALCNAIETGRVGHAYLFTGARGVGKTSTARIFAKALNDPAGPNTTPDQDSDISLAIDAGEDVDVIEIDGASNRGIDEIRSLRSNINVRPSRARYKIYIIDEVHMLTPAAFNALLKTLEEPPEHVKFIFCTTDPEKIPITVLSRCQRFDFAPVEVDKIVGRLREIITAESAEADDDALELIARRAAGSMRDSQSLLEQVLSFSDRHLTADQVHAMLGTADDERLHAMAKSLAQRDAATAMKQLDAAIDAGVDAGRMAEQLLGYFRDLMAAAVGCDATMMRYCSASLHDELRQLGEQWGLQTVLAIVGLLDETLVRIRLSVHARVLLEATLVQVANLPDLQAITDLTSAAKSLPPAAAIAGSEKKKRVADAIQTRQPIGTTADAASIATVITPAENSTVETSTSPAPSPPRLDAGHSAIVRPSRDNTSLSATSGTAGVATASQQAVTNAASASRSSVNHVTDLAAANPSATIASGPNAEPATESVATPPAPTPVVSDDRPDVPWNVSNIRKLMTQALNQVDPMTASLLRQADRIEPAGDSRIRVVFPADAALTMRRCDTPERKQEVVAALSGMAGKSIQLDFDATAPARRPKQETKAAPTRNRMQMMREIESHPLVQSCLELFEAEIVKVDFPRS